MSGHRLDVARMGRGVAQSLPDFVNCSVQASVEIDEGVAGPEPTAQFLPGNQLARPFQQGKENLERLLI
jgi:hypothetical protein